MSNGPEPISITVYPTADGKWWIRLTRDTGDVETKGPVSWSGEGSFYDQGLNSVVAWIPRGYAYQSWLELGDGSYTSTSPGAHVSPGTPPRGRKTRTKSRRVRSDSLAALPHDHAGLGSTGNDDRNHPIHERPSR